MGKITNLLGLPEPIYLAVCGDTYSPGESDITVTQLSQPSRLWALKKQHAGEIEVDAADRIYSLVGQVGHGIAERLSNNPRYIAEQRFYMKVDGVKLGGQIDLYDRETKTLYDYKFCSTWVSKDGVKDEWVQQGNVNKLLLETNGHEVKAITYIAIYRDWSKTRAGQGDMPKLPVEQFPIALWAPDYTRHWISERVTSHQAALISLPECTEEERWAKPAVFAVMKAGRKSALRLFSGEKESSAFAAENNGYVVRRAGEDTRCVNYCEVNKFCKYYQEKYGDSSALQKSVETIS